MLRTDHSDDHIRFLQLMLGGDRNFSYLVGDPRTGEAAAVDPGFAPERMADMAGSAALQIRHVLLTHGHSDHVGGAPRLAALTGATIHAGHGSGVRGAHLLGDGERVPVGGLEVQALLTPGHSPGHVCYLVEGRLLTGDLLFCGKVGGTGSHFPGSSAAAEWDSLHRLLKLPDETFVFPGHDYYGGAGSRPWSTIGHERSTNPFLLCSTFEEFTSLKDGWAEYKIRHGIR